MIGIVDYGMGNLRSVRNALEVQGIDATVVATPEAVAAAPRLIVPGVGAFAHAMAELHDRGLVDPIRQAAHAGIPILGICLGMQLLVTRGTESAVTGGLDLVPGSCDRLAVDPPLRLPHVGWNALQLQRPHPLLTGVRLGADYYFVHSYVVEPTDPADIIATADHGRPFAAVVGRRNVIGMQFHPEKSQTSGLRILENFAQWDGAC